MSFRPVAALVHKLHYFSAQSYGVHYDVSLHHLHILTQPNFTLRFV